MDVNDLWNIAGVSGGVGYGVGGQPWITSHYGYFMSSWHLIFALSGQQANLPAGTLSFNPADSSLRTKPWSYPVLLPGILGIISHDIFKAKSQPINKSQYKLEILLGEITVSRKLSVMSVDYSGKYPLTIKSGESVKWTTRLGNQQRMKNINIIE